MIKRVFLSGIFLWICSIALYAQAPPPPPANAGSSGGPVGGPTDAPIDGGTIILIALALSYLVWKWYTTVKIAEQEGK